jgi:hypothetical protein
MSAGGLDFLRIIHLPAELVLFQRCDSIRGEIQDLRSSRVTVRVEVIPDGELAFG